MCRYEKSLRDNGVITPRRSDDEHNRRDFSHRPSAPGSSWPRLFRDRVVILARGFLLPVEPRVLLIDPRAVRLVVPPERDADVPQELVHPRAHVEWTSPHAPHAGLAAKDHDRVAHEVD